MKRLKVSHVKVLLTLEAPGKRRATELEEIEEL
jgi:hypothetical protein